MIRNKVGLGGRNRTLNWALMAVLGLFGLGGSLLRGDEPLFQFGVIADVQYADKADAGTRHYRASLGILERAVATLNVEDLAFVVNLGDIIDGNGTRSEAELTRILRVLTQLNVPVRHVVGNHCLEIPRPKLQRHLGLETTWYAFQRPGWRMVVLDAMDVSIKAPEGSAAREAATAWLAEHPEAPTYNGAIGPEQLAWFKSELTAARRAGERVLVFCHHPAHPDASDANDVLWNYAAVLAVMAEAGPVAAWFNGHDHRGGYAQRQQTHFVTLPGLVEAPAEQGGAHAVVEVWPDHLVIRGSGKVPSRRLPLPGGSAPNSPPPPQ
jgi:hypothetical protein